MKKYLDEYIAMLEKLLKDGKISNFEYIKSEHIKQVQFIQHERLIHFLVTMMFAIIEFICLGIFLVTSNMGVLALVILVLGLLIPYIVYYYYLENHTQKLYLLYSQICNVELQQMSNHDDITFPLEVDIKIKD
jgi:hypothetical protein